MPPSVADGVLVELAQTSGYETEPEPTVVEDEAPAEASPLVITKPFPRGAGGYTRPGLMTPTPIMVADTPTPVVAADAPAPVVVTDAHTTVVVTDTPTADAEIEEATADVAVVEPASAGAAAVEATSDEAAAEAPPSEGTPPAATASDGQKA